MGKTRIGDSGQNLINKPISNGVPCSLKTEVDDFPINQFSDLNWSKTAMWRVVFAKLKCLKHEHFKIS